MRNFCVMLTAAALLASNAFAADMSTNSGALASGKPAGLRKAQDDSDNTLFYVVGLGAIAAGIAIVASSSSDKSGVSAPTTTQ